jgi:hypothetical protein
VIEFVDHDDGDDDDDDGINLSAGFKLDGGQVQKHALESFSKKLKSALIYENYIFTTVCFKTEERCYN